MRVAIATFSGMPPEFRDDELLLELLAERGIEVAYEPWDAAGFDWNGFDLVVARSPWDYAARREEFLSWVEGVEAPLENSAEVIAWNSDKRYLGDLAAAGVPVVPTSYAGPGDPIPGLEGELVVKPAVSAGARSTGRFGPGSHEGAAELVERIRAGGGTAMIQPYLSEVDTGGETAVVTIAGEVSHVLRKGALLSPDEVAPTRSDGLGVAEAMYDPELVHAGSAADDELHLARVVVEAVGERFGAAPLVARVDLLRDDDGCPVLLELEAIEPNLYFPQAPGAAERLADAIVARARSAA